MLVLTRKSDQKIQIGENITVTVIEVKGRYVRLGIEAPRAVRIVRSEIAVPPLPPVAVPHQVRPPEMHGLGDASTADV
jgi:carbon storage regulator CsrA